MDGLPELDSPARIAQTFLLGQAAQRVPVCCLPHAHLQRKTQEQLEQRAAALAHMRQEGDLFALMSTLRMDYLRQTGAYCARSGWGLEPSRQ